MPFVFPVPGFYLGDTPAVAHDCDDPRCLETGAFTTDPPEDPPPSADTDTEDPADAGSLDSEE